MAIFLITAPSGAGKTTLVHELKRLKIWEECISHTTRPMRDGEKDGVTYYFMEDGDFADSIELGEFAEYVEYDGHAYGVSKKEIERVLSKNKHVAIIVEYNGYLQIKEKYPDAIGIFVHMSKEDCLANMLLRGDSIEKALKRISTYEKEMKNKGEYDYVVKNVRNRQEYTVSVIRAIISQNHQNRITSIEAIL